ncbi:MAG: biotin/lipoyl-binding protein [Pseudomonadota bacterium]
MKQLLLFSAALALGGCGDSHEGVTPTEKLAPRAWVESIDVEGEIKSAANTSLTVPGTGWENRELLSMVEDGTVVRKGDVIATFDAPRTRMELSQAEVEMVRKELVEKTLVANAAVTTAGIAADSAKVSSDLTLSERYGDIKAEAGVLTRNQILDALQDTRFLKNKQSYLGWKTGQVGVRTAADRTVVTTQKNSISLQTGQRRSSLAALQLLAPHDGIFVQAVGWDGSKVQIGASLWSGHDLGKLPDLTKLIASFSVAEGKAFGIKVGQSVRARLAGTGSLFNLKITKVSSNASTKSRESPVKYSEFQAEIPPEVVASLKLNPGQAVRATVLLVDRAPTLTLPNLALVQEGETFAVFVGENAPGVKKIVQLGQRGTVRSEIKSGLASGEFILLVPPGSEGKEGSNAKTDQEKEKKST